MQSENLQVSGIWYWYTNNYIPDINNNTTNFPFTKDDKITFVGQVGTQGYSILCKETILKLREKGYSVNYIPHGGLDVEDHFYLSIYNKNFDEHETTCYIVTLPPFSAASVFKSTVTSKTQKQKVYAHCLWDSEYIKKEYIEDLNKNFDGLIVVSEWNKNAFKKCGLTIPVYKLTYEPNLIDIPDRASSIEFVDKLSFVFGNQKDLSKTINFYTIGQWTNRKGITETIEAFCDAFQNGENVSLILKTFHTAYSHNDIRTCINRISKITAKYKNCPCIYYIAGNLSTQGIFKIHSVGDIYLSLTRSEGIGLGPLIAANYKRPVIITKYGAQAEYLSKFNDIDYIDYKLIDAKDDLNFGMDLNNQKWAQPDLQQAKSLIYKAYKFKTNLVSLNLS